jgi:hypothetical protein
VIRHICRNQFGRIEKPLKSQPAFVTTRDIFDPVTICHVQMTLFVGFLDMSKKLKIWASFSQCLCLAPFTLRFETEYQHHVMIPYS